MDLWYSKYWQYMNRNRFPDFLINQQLSRSSKTIFEGAEYRRKEIHVLKFPNWLEFRCLLFTYIFIKCSYKPQFDVENLLCIPDESLQIAGQDDLCISIREYSPQQSSVLLQLIPLCLDFPQCLGRAHQIADDILCVVLLQQLLIWQVQLKRRNQNNFDFSIILEFMWEKNVFFSSESSDFIVHTLKIDFGQFLLCLQIVWTFENRKHYFSPWTPTRRQHLLASWWAFADSPPTFRPGRPLHNAAGSFGRSSFSPANTFNHFILSLWILDSCKIVRDKKKLGEKQHYACFFRINN